MHVQQRAIFNDPRDLDDSRAVRVDVECQSPDLELWYHSMVVSDDDVELMKVESYARPGDPIDFSSCLGPQASGFDQRGKLFDFLSAQV